MPAPTLFSGYDTTHGTELWVTDGTGAGTSLLTDIYPGAQGSYPTQLTVLGSNVLFVAADATHGSELWVSNGTAAGTHLVDDINPGVNPSTVNNLTVLGSQAIFTANDGVNGQELWATDGTMAGTVLLKDITPGGGSSAVKGIGLFGSQALFTVYAPDGFDLWTTDGTAAGTVEIKNLGTTAQGESAPGFTVAGGRDFFAASDGTNGTELWVTDGTAAGTVLVKDIDPGAGSSVPNQFTPIGNNVLFAAYDGNANDSRLWMSDGTSAGTTLITSAPAQVYSLTAFKGGALFVGPTSRNYQDLWFTDGTAAGTHDLGAVAQGNLAVLGNLAVFAGFDTVNGTELWVSDGTAAGTHLIDNIDPGNASSTPQNLTVVGGQVLFSATDVNGVTALFSTDGTGAGTVEQSTAVNPVSTFATPACFATGTRILTPLGEVAVERLAAGDVVVTPDGDAVIGWVGRSRVDPARHPRPWDIHPVRVTAGAFGAGLPSRDLLLSPEHALLAGGALIPVRHLVNDTTIVQQAGGPVVYWHIELPSHAVVYAEGLPAESYRDTGNRAAFDDAPVRALHPSFDGPSFDSAAAAPTYAPLVSTGATLERVRARLADVAAARRVAAAPILELSINGPGAVLATVPACVTGVRLVSGIARAPGDKRCLGVAVAGVTLAGTPIPLQSPHFAAGFHGLEAGGWRWTDGRAMLLLPPADAPRTLLIDVTSIAAAA